MGVLFSRKLKSAQYLTSLPGAPDGEYDKDGRSRVQGTTSNRYQEMSATIPIQLDSARRVQ